VLRRLSVIGLSGVFVLGCVSIAPAAPTASSPASFSVATPAAATVAPLPTATAPLATAAVTPVPPTAPPPTQQATTPAPATPEAPPSEPPTSAVPASQEPGASPAGVENYGASTPLFDDSFDDPASGWGVGTNDGGTVAYGDDHLEITTSGTGAWETSLRLTGSTDNAIHLQTIFTASGSGYLGLLCANRDDELWGVAANELGDYSFIKIQSGAVTALSQGHLDALSTASTGGGLALDCAGAATGSFRMQVSPGGTNVGAQYFAQVDVGPRNFDRAGVYAESSAHPYSVSVDYVLAFGGDGDTSMSPEAKDLMTHIPADWQPKCFEAFASFFAKGAVADILCQPDGGRSDYAEYTRFDTQANMDAYFQYLATKWAQPEQGLNCDTGAHQGTYSIAGQPGGMVLCAPSISGTQFVWTTNDLLIQSQLIDLEGSYPDMYQDWLIAGPN
jgi:hypothetical protein